MPTDRNPSDGASRGDIDQDCLKYDWERVQAVADPGWYVSKRKHKLDLFPNKSRNKQSPQGEELEWKRTRRMTSQSFKPWRPIHLVGRTR